MRIPRRRQDMETGSARVAPLPPECTGLYSAYVEYEIFRLNYCGAAPVRQRQISEQRDALGARANTMFAVRFGDN